MINKLSFEIEFNTVGKILKKNGDTSQRSVRI